MNRQSKNAQRIAEALQGHAKIDKVIYPSLFDDLEQLAICDRHHGITPEISFELVPEAVFTQSKTGAHLSWRTS
jgi:cystathionine beta-lyase/cystathionine gamma-synthase